MGQLDTQPLEVNDFSLGITDFYIDGKPQESQVMDNLYVTSNKKARTREGSTIEYPQMPLGSIRVNKMSRLNQLNLFFQNQRAFFWDTSLPDPDWTEVFGPNGTNKFFPVNTGPMVISDSVWRNHLLFAEEGYSYPQKFFVDDAAEKKVITAGLPAIEVPPILAASDDTHKYLYAFCYRYTYNNLNFEHVTLGPYYMTPQVFVSGEVGPGEETEITLNWTLSDTQNWDYTNFEMDIYRTVNGGNAFYLVATVANGTTTYEDDTTDGNLVLGETAYFNGDGINYVKSHDTPPQCKYVHIVNDSGYYANITDESGNVDPTLIRQSRPGVIDGVPTGNYANTEQPIGGLSSIFDRPLVFCDEYIYRVDGFYDAFGNDGMRLIKIEDTAGIVSNLSIVRTPIGIFWAGRQGFYWSDGLNVRLITPHLPKSYANWTLNETKQKRIVGTYDKAEQRVKWTIAGETNEVDSVLVLHLKFTDTSVSVHPCFTTLSGAESFVPTYIMQVGKDMFRGDSRGYVLRHNEDFAVDPRIDVESEIENWEENAIVYTYKSTFLDFGSKFYRKWVPRILISASNTTNLSLAISSSNDNDRIIGELKPIRYTANITWGDTFPLWGDATAVWAMQGLIEEWRRFPAGGLRCNYKQITFMNANTEIVTSELLGLGNTNPTLKTVTVDELPENIVGYFISFKLPWETELDYYSKQFEIVSSNATTLTYKDEADAGPVLPGNYEYIIRGYPKGQILELNGYVIHWAYISKSHTPFSTSSLGSSPT